MEAVVNPVPVGALRAQAWKYFFLLFAWPLYLFLLPAAVEVLGPFALLFMVFPGVYLFTWLGYLMHESWHSYVPNVPNRFFYQVFAYMLLTDPQAYRMIHGHHHKEVNTHLDIEFHPFGRIRHRALLIVHNALEIILGTAYIVLVSGVTLPKDPRFRVKYRRSRFAVSLIVWAVFFGGIGFASAAVFDLRWTTVAAAYGVLFWLGSLMVHHSQLVEHGNLIVEGEWNKRNVKTRNLDNHGVPEKIFLFLTHGDSFEHVLHHTRTAVHSRLFPGLVPLPPEAVKINFRQYGVILKEMLTGRPSAF